MASYGPFVSAFFNIFTHVFWVKEQEFNRNDARKKPIDNALQGNNRVFAVFFELEGAIIYLDLN
jgi:hypothetical protein